MKRLLILQNKGKSVGGIWYVNKTIATELSKDGYDVLVLSIRNNKNNFTEDNLNFDIRTVNEDDLWEITHKRDVVSSIKKIRFFRTLYKYFVDNYKLRKDYKKATKILKDYKPDYVVVSHYQLMDVVPKDYLSKTIYHHHTSFDNSISNKSLRKMFDKYNGKIRFLWLTKSTMNSAVKYGLVNNWHIYNPVRYELENVNRKKDKLITVITRFGSEKRIPLMVEIVDKAFKKAKDKDWKFELYGGNEIKNFSYNYDKNKIKFMGLTNDPKSILWKSSINLNTSKFEGFSLSILEANECGVPTISFDFGESVFEQIVDNKTGIIVNDVEEYIDKLVSLIDNPNELKRLSKNCIEFNKQFHVGNIIDCWYKLFLDMDGGNND